MDPAELATKAIELVTPYLPAVAEAGVRVGVEEAARGLFNAIARPLRSKGEGAALEEFVRDPNNSALVRRLLTQAIQERADFAASLAAAVQAMPATSYRHTEIYNQSGNKAGRDFIGRDSYQSSHDNRKKTTIGGGIAAVVVVAIIAAAAIFIATKIFGGGEEQAGLTADSTCSEFVQEDQAEAQSAMRRIGLELGVSGIGSPLAWPAISYACSQTPSARLGDVILRHKSSF